ncbi:MAG: hypothetical protein ABSD57_03705 [Verrucomicrobiota bacterium]|jgi:hypothetical protein
MNFTLLKRYIPLTVWVVAVFTIVIVPLKIISYGFLPGDDALRHAAKAVSGKTWQQILVMRSDFAIDPSPGWQTILEWIHRWQGCDAETLVVFSIVALMLLVTLSALPWLRRPEAWLGALLVAAVFAPACTTRLARGRPYLVTTAVLITLLFLWSRLKENREDRPSRLALGLTPLLVAASAWIHGSWYLLGLPALAILFAGYWRSALWFGVCWLAGSFLGSALTGHPWEFLFQSVRHMFGVFGHLVVNRQLEPELHPSDGETPAVLVVAALLLWRTISSGWNPRVVLNPIFILMILGWLLGLKVRRFWWDFGTPAFMVWVACELQDRLERHLAFDSGKRLLIALGLAAGCYWGFTSDRESRWTENLTTEYLTPATPGAAGWVPGTNGIIYNSTMDVFFNMFYQNPTAPWRYILGFESGLMQPEDLEVLRKIQWNYGDARAYEPWVKKMRPEDRMMIQATSVRSGPPGIPELEWHYAVSGLWVGRLPRSTNSPPTIPQPNPTADGTSGRN